MNIELTVLGDSQFLAYLIIIYIYTYIYIYISKVGDHS